MPTKADRSLAIDHYQHIVDKQLKDAVVRELLDDDDSLQDDADILYSIRL